MECKFNNGQIIFETSKAERKNIEIIRGQLLDELSYFAELEYEQLIFETETFLLPNLIAERLVKIKVDTVQNLAFSDAHYKEKCFYINSNGHPAITENEQNFYSFIYAFDMLNDMDNGLRTAKGIVKVCIIDRMVKQILESDKKSNVENLEDIRPFRKKEHFENFKTYIQNHIIEPYVDLSYLFQRLKHEKFIEDIRHLKFAEWLLVKGFISRNIYEDIYTKEGFYAFSKFRPGNHRENNFNNVFEID